MFERNSGAEKIFHIFLVNVNFNEIIWDGLDWFLRKVPAP
jgi:hypothetical protein